MTRSSFVGALGFALLTAALSLPVQILGAYAWGYEGSLAAYLLALTPFGLFQAAPDVRSGVRVWLVSGLMAFGLLCVVSRVETALLGVIVMLALGRASLSGPRPFARVLTVELVLGGLSFVAFAAFRDRHLVGDALAVWAFWLVQSGFALVTHSTSTPVSETVDAFDAARCAAERLMQPR